MEKGWCSISPERISDRSAHSTVPRQLPTLLQKQHFEKRLIKEKRKRMSSWQERVSWTRDAVRKRESAPDLVCKVLERGRASAKGGTEAVGSAIEGQSLSPSEFSHRRGNEAIERSNPRSTLDACWEAG